jgi:hypothetical protein
MNGSVFPMVKKKKKERKKECKDTVSVEPFEFSVHSSFEPCSLKLCNLTKGNELEQ